MPLATPTSDLSQRISANNLGRDTFRSWVECTPCWYDLVEQTIGAGREIFWGYCPEHQAYFISRAIPEPVRIALLQMEHHRLSNTMTHLEAVQYALKQPSDFSRADFVTSIFVFYSEGGPIFDTGEVRPNTYEQDIAATGEYTKSLM